jgi:hypothetical protein
VVRSGYLGELLFRALLGIGRLLLKQSRLAGPLRFHADPDGRYFFAEGVGLALEVGNREGTEATELIVQDCHLLPEVSDLDREFLRALVGAETADLRGLKRRGDDRRGYGLRCCPGCSLRGRWLQLRSAVSRCLRRPRLGGVSPDDPTLRWRAPRHVGASSRVLARIPLVGLASWAACGTRDDAFPRKRRDVTPPWVTSSANLPVVGTRCQRPSPAPTEHRSSR